MESGSLASFWLPVASWVSYLTLGLSVFIFLSGKNIFKNLLHRFLLNS